MKKPGRSRLIRPAAAGVLGTAIAGATAVGSSWANAFILELFVVLIFVGLYAVGGTSSDVGAVIGRREDERQRIVEQRALSLSMKVMYAAAFVCAAIAIALKENYWQADVIGTCGGVAFFVGLRLFGHAEPLDDLSDHGSGE
ncbi:MAG: DUF2178 domain-containing protein [Acidimicrobiales bacterium]